MIYFFSAKKLSSRTIDMTMRQMRALPFLQKSNSLSSYMKYLINMVRMCQQTTEGSNAQIDED